MKKFSLTLMTIVVVMSLVLSGCKKVDGPKPSTQTYLTAKTWVATSAKDPSGNSINLSNCDGLSLQYSGAGDAYGGDGPTSSCGSPTKQGTWTLDGMTATVKNSGSTIYKLEISSISATDMSADVIFTGQGTYKVVFAAE